MPLSLLHFRVKLKSYTSSFISLSGNAPRGMAHGGGRLATDSPDVRYTQSYSKERFDRIAIRRQAMRR
jgi:hypothetical protein